MPEKGNNILEPSISTTDNNSKKQNTKRKKNNFNNGRIEIKNQRENEMKLNKKHGNSKI